MLRDDLAMNTHLHEATMKEPKQTSMILHRAILYVLGLCNSHEAYTVGLMFGQYL